MAKKMRRARIFARTAPKSREKSLIEQAKRLGENPCNLLPKYPDDCRKYFAKLQKRLQKVQRYKDDTKKLEKLANKKGLEGALAGTLLLAVSEKAPYLAVAKFPTGDITYAQRGKAAREKLIAVQHCDDPVLRLLGIKDIAMKKRLHVYSWDDRFVCTGTKAYPPKEFITFIQTKLGLLQKQGTSTCKHINWEQAQQKKYTGKNYLRLQWRSADLLVVICEECAKTTENTLFTMSKYFLEHDVAGDFAIEVVANAVHDTGTAGTLHLPEYLAGEITDYDLIRKNVTGKKELLQQSKGRLLILNEVSYGSDVAKFVDALQPDAFQRAGLTFILNNIDEPVIVSGVSPNKILEMYWDRYGKACIDSIIDDKNMATSFFALDDTPSNILQTVFDYNERQQILAQLPRYSSLSPLARYADHIAKTYKTYGVEKTLRELKKRPDTPKGKSLAYAFLLVFRKNVDAKWQYVPEEIEYGEFLKTYAEKLLNATPKEYTLALQDLLQASGSTETIELSEKR